MAHYWTHIFADECPLCHEKKMVDLDLSTMTLYGYKVSEIRKAIRFCQMMNHDLRNNETNLRH